VFSPKKETFFFGAFQFAFTSLQLAKSDGLFTPKHYTLPAVENSVTSTHLNEEKNKRKIKNE